MNDYSNFYPSYEKFIVNGGNIELEMQLNGIEGKDVKINKLEETSKVLIQLHTNPLSENKDDFKIVCKKDIGLKQGDNVYYIEQKDNYIVKTKPQINEIYSYAELEYCNQTYKLMSDKGLIEYPCVAKLSNSMSSGSDSGRNTPIQDYPYMITIQANEDTIKTNENIRFIFGRNVYKVAKVEDSLSYGLLYIYFDVDQKRPNDDFINGIADNSDGYTLDTNIDNITSNVNYTTQIISTVYKDGELLSPQPTIEYKSSDINIATVDNSGNVELIAEGNCILNVIFGSIKKEINVVVNAITPVQVITFALNPLITKLTQFDGVTSIECEKYIDGVKDTVASLTITDEPQGFTGGYNFSVSGNTFTLKNKSIAGKTLNVKVDDGLGNNETFNIKLTAW